MKTHETKHNGTSSLDSSCIIPAIQSKYPSFSALSNAAALAFCKGVGAQKFTAVWVARSGAARRAGAIIYPDLRDRIKSVSLKRACHFRNQGLPIGKTRLKQTWNVQRRKKKVGPTLLSCPHASQCRRRSSQH